MGKKEEDEEREQKNKRRSSSRAPLFNPSIFYFFNYENACVAFFLFLDENYIVGMPNHLSDLPFGL